MQEQCYALLIDADNVSAKYIKPILTELSKYGIITYKRIYGDWTSTQHSSWKDELLTNSITPIQQFSYTQGKNSTDSAMIIDAMDILYTNDVDGFALYPVTATLQDSSAVLERAERWLLAWEKIRLRSHSGKRVISLRFWKI